MKIDFKHVANVFGPVAGIFSLGCIFGGVVGYICGKSDDNDVVSEETKTRIVDMEQELDDLSERIDKQLENN